MMMMPVAVAVAANCLREIRDVGELAAGRGVGEIRGECGELGRRGRIPVVLRGLGGGFQIRGDLLRNLRVLGWIRLLNLLERAQQLRERRKLAAVLWLSNWLSDRR